MGAYRDYISEDADMQTMIFRYSVLVDVFGARLPNELKCENKLSDELKKKILRKPYSEQINRLIMLFGMGIVDEETVKNVILFNEADWLEDAVSLENRVRYDEEREIDSDKKILNSIFTVCANSRKYPEINGVSFETAEKILASPYTSAVNGFIHIDKDLLSFMNKSEIAFGFYDKDVDSMYTETADNVSQAAALEDYDINSETVPIPFDYAALNCCLDVYGKKYAEDFMSYALENNIPFSDDFYAEYEKYINDVKLCFDIKAYVRKRNICGDTVNYFDYAHNVMTDGKLISTLEAENNYSCVIRIDTNDVYSEKELEERAFKKYLQSHQPLENMVFEVYHCKKIKLYIFRSGSFEVLAAENEDIFRKQLFDFDEIWAVIKACSDSGKLLRKDDTIVMSSEFIECIRPEWYCYAERIIADQYGRRKRNMIAATLNELRGAADEFKKKLAEKKAEEEAKKAARNQGLVIKNKNENGGN